MEKSHATRHTGDTFTCSICDADFNMKGKLTTHKHEMHGHEPFPGSIKCTQCNRFITGSSMKNHMDNHAESARACKQKCILCGKSCKSEQYLKNHMAKVHKLGDYSCDLCDVLFATNQGLGVHCNKVHSGVPFKGSIKCPECGLYVTRGTKWRHLKRLHPKSEYLRENRTKTKRVKLRGNRVVRISLINTSLR